MGLKTTPAASLRSLPSVRPKRTTAVKPKQAKAYAEHRAIDEGRFDFTLPLPPSANNYWRTATAPTSSGKARAVTYVSEAAKKYKMRAKEAAHAAGVVPLRGATHLILRVHPDPVKQDMDLGNHLKVLEDALNGVAYVDDVQNRRISLEMLSPDAKNPRVDVTVVSASLMPKVLPAIAGILEKYKLLDSPMADEIRAILSETKFKNVLNHEGGDSHGETLPQEQAGPDL